MAGWEIALIIVAAWFAVSLLVAVVIGKALRFTSGPEPVHVALTVATPKDTAARSDVPMNSPERQRLVAA
jgi:hypothetical protein